MYPVYLGSKEEQEVTISPLVVYNITIIPDQCKIFFVKYVLKLELYHAVKKSRVFLLPQLWIINYCVKSSSNNLSNENVNTGVSVVFKTKHE